jgi:hypothetical protein
MSVTRVGPQRLDGHGGLVPDRPQLRIDDSRSRPHGDWVIVGVCCGA